MVALPASLSSPLSLTLACISTADGNVEVMGLPLLNTCSLPVDILETLAFRCSFTSSWKDRLAERFSQLEERQCGGGPQIPDHIVHIVHNTL